MRDGGKGDTPRPLSVTMEQFDKNFDAIFKKKPVKTYTGNKANYVLDKPKENTQNETCNGK